MKAMLIKKTSVPLFLALLLAASLEPSFAQTKRGIRSVDFYNFTYDLYNGAKVTLKNGSYKENSIISDKFRSYAVEISFVENKGLINDMAVVSH